VDIERAKLHKGKPIFEKRLGSPRSIISGIKTSEKVAEVLTQVPHDLIQERLMTMAVREIAISVFHSREDTKKQLASLMPAVKAQRYWSELSFLKKLDVSYFVCATITDKVVGLLHGVGDVSHRSYIRPSSRN
jgi:hypothetical protein